MAISYKSNSNGLQKKLKLLISISFVLPPQEKDKAFKNATNELKADLHALAILIRPSEEIAE